MSLTSSVNIIPFHQRANKKLIPIDAHFNGVISEILFAALARFNLDNMALQYRCVSNNNCRYFFAGMDDAHDDVSGGFRIGDECIHTQQTAINKALDRASARSVVIPINVNGHHSGNVIALSESHHNTDELYQSLSHVVSEITGVIKRYLIRDTVIHRYAEKPYWIGRSFELRHVESLTEKLAQSSLPVVIRGEKGTGKVVAATALHCHRFCESAPFIESHCDNWASGDLVNIMEDLVARCCGGTLFLRHIDKLSAADFLVLRTLLHARLDRDRHHPFFIATVTDPVEMDHPVVAWMEFDAVDLPLPHLRDRKRDIRDLTPFFLQDYAAEKNLSLTEDAYALLEQFDWPDNVYQLERMIKKMVVMADQPMIDSHRLVSWFPSLKKNTSGALLPAQRAQTKVVALNAPLVMTPSIPPLLNASSLNPSSLNPSSLNASSLNENALHLSSLRVTPLVVDRVLADHSLSLTHFLGVDHLDNEHPALIKAIDYILHHFQEPITMADVASRACISASHLSYLFKCRLQRSFKQVMTEIRIDKAKYFFQKLPSRQITQVSSDVGFSDLSHFEKTFKRRVGISPRAYRNQFRPPLSTAT